MRLIDADAFLERMKRTNRYFSVKFDIDAQPTVDVVEMAHGKWKLYETNCYSKIWECSECKGKWDFHTKHCPYCGAKMDGKKVE